MNETTKKDSNVKKLLAKKIIVDKILNIEINLN